MGPLAVEVTPTSSPSSFAQPDVVVAAADIMDVPATTTTTTVAATTLGLDSMNPVTTTTTNETTAAATTSGLDRMIPVIQGTDAIQTVITMIRRQIELLILDDDTLIGAILRLVFHDCVGGCDGCVDLTNPENNGLQIPITALQPIVDEFEVQGVLSRTDIWMLSSLVATELALPTENSDLLY